MIEYSPTVLFIVFIVLLILTAAWFILLYTEPYGEGRLAHNARSCFDRKIEKIRDGMRSMILSLINGSLKVRNQIKKSAGTHMSTRRFLDKEKVNTDGEPSDYLKNINK